ncbi:esterase-like activity of phytase family protein [Agarilytica rhodophyticola]|uniref:esterase-like activity of phytase family protein n=1 Tax=Agarilytica rhodophyticola TaxID=1737490 RepID=UPI000B349D3A|nr:esterase-like activity of phytase family protein [Agarilytica rhodophyticola]
MIRFNNLTKRIVYSTLAVTIGCSTYVNGNENRHVPHRLVGWAALDQSEREQGPTSGQFINGQLGITPPFFNTQPIPGWSGLLRNNDGSFTALPDNGFGAKGNSADYLIGFYNVKVDFKKRGDGTTKPGNIENQFFVPFNDRNNLLKNGKGIDLVITADLENYRKGSGFGENSNIPVDSDIKDNRLLTGYDFDVESIARANDGSYWVGEEFGPFLLHFDAEGTLIEEPVAHPFLVSPFHPVALALPEEATHGASRGFESLAFDNDNEFLYAVPEAAPVKPELRPRAEDERVLEIFQFDPKTSSYTGVTYKYRKDGPVLGNNIVIGDMTNVGKDKYVLIERDSKFGANAEVKRLYIIDLNVTDEDGILRKRLLIDLLDINDPKDIGGPLEGLADKKFSMPFDSIESLVVFNRKTLGVAIDTNFPSEDGRAPGTPDSTEFIKLKFPRPIARFAPSDDE